MTRTGPALLAIVLALAVASCFGDKRPPRTAGTALWIGEKSVAPTAGELERLANQGIVEYFVESGRLRLDGGTLTIHPVGAVALPRRERTTLVVSGKWPLSPIDPEVAARSLAEGIVGLRLEADRSGRLPVGVHFDVEASGSLASFASTLSELREALDEELYLSATVSRRELVHEEVSELLAPLDFAVAFLYGQRPGETEDSAAWDLLAVERSVRRLEELDCPYYLGAVTVGTASWRGKGGETRAETTELDLASLVLEDRLELKRGFTLEGIDRQVYEFRARRPVRVGLWQIGASESIRVVRAATTNIEELLRRAGAWDPGNRLGILFWRLPRANERLSMTGANVADALSPDPARPALDLLVERSDARRDAWTLSLTLANRNDEASDLAFFESNYVTLSVRGGRIADVDPGDFARFELYRGEERATMRAIREADSVRLYVPVIEGRQRLDTGAILFRIEGDDPTIQTSGRFVLTDGEMLDLEIREWSFGGDD